MSTAVEYANALFLRKTLGTQYEPVGTRFLWF